MARPGVHKSGGNEMTDNGLQEATVAKTWTMTVPQWTPALLNDVMGKHWQRAHKIKRKQAEMLAVYARLQDVPRATGKRKLSVTCYGWPTGRIPDQDAIWKLLLDSLVRAQLLTDDGPSGLEGAATVEFVRSEKKQTILRFEECA